MVRLKRRSMATENSALETPRRRTRAGASTRERILIQAERLFASRGFNGVTMPAIAEASGITAGAIYKHFTSKAELFFHVVRQAVEQAPMGARSGSLPAMVASCTTRRLKQVRQMAVEVHPAAAEGRRRAPPAPPLARPPDRRDSRWLRRGSARGRPSGRRPAMLKAAVMAFIMGLMHMETPEPAAHRRPTLAGIRRGSHRRPSRRSLTPPCGSGAV